MVTVQLRNMEFKLLFFLGFILWLDMSHAQGTCLTFLKIG